LRIPLEGRLGLVLLITVFNDFLLSGFHPIIAGMNGIHQRFLLSVDRTGFRDLDLQITAVQTEKSCRLEKIMETTLGGHLQDNALLMPVLADTLIHVDRTALGTFPSLHVNLLRDVHLPVLPEAGSARSFVNYWKIVCFAYER
jgi:hypothetical protein